MTAPMILPAVLGLVSIVLIFYGRSRIKENQRRFPEKFAQREKMRAAVGMNFLALICVILAITPKTPYQEERVGGFFFTTFAITFLVVGIAINLFKNSSDPSDLIPSKRENK